LSLSGKGAPLKRGKRRKKGVPVVAIREGDTAEKRKKKKKGVPVVAIREGDTAEKRKRKKKRGACCRYLGRGHR
jgi:hypothetical protein